jgi:hypothetical protein
MFWHSAECEAVLALYGLTDCSMTIVGADRGGEPPTWGVTVICEAGRSHFLDIHHARRLSADLLRIKELDLAARISRAIESAARRASPQE